MQLRTLYDDISRKAIEIVRYSVVVVDVPIDPDDLDVLRCFLRGMEVYGNGFSPYKGISGGD